MPTDYGNAGRYIGPLEEQVTMTADRRRIANVAFVHVLVTSLDDDDIRAITGEDTLSLTDTAVPVCRHCHEPAGRHCPDCSACPDQECPDWCGDGC